MHSGPFGCLTKLGANWAELVQKFVPRSRIRIFHNERTQSTPLDPKLPSFGCLTKLGAKRVELVQKFVPQSRVGILHNERTRSTTLDPKLIFWCISYYLCAFGTVWLPSKLGAKRAELVQNLCHEVTSEFFRTNAPDPPHWTLN